MTHHHHHLFKDVGTPGQTVFHTHTVFKLDEWTQMKRLMEYLHTIGPLRNMIESQNGQH